MSNGLPRFYAVNDRPCAMVSTPSGGADMLVLDMRTGALVPDRSYFLRVSEPGKDVDSLTSEQFDALVSEIRQRIVAFRLEQAIEWEATGDGEFPYAANLDGHRHTVRINDFPAEPLYTLLVEDQVLTDLDDWPTPWRRPSG